MRRDKFEIAIAILNICKTGARKTKIVYQANLNFRTVDQYLNPMIRNGLIDIEEEGSSRFYMTTPKGSEMRKEFESICDFLT